MLELDSSPKQAVLYSAVEPDEKQKAKFLKFLTDKYSSEISLTWKQSDMFPGGFRLEVDSEIYDWSVNGRFQQLKDTLVQVPTKNGNVIPLIKEKIEEWQPEVIAQEVGSVISVGDGIATVSGLEHVTFGEIIRFSSGAKGMVLDLGRNQVGCVIFDDDENISEGITVYRTGKMAGMPVGENFLGRIIDPLGEAIDNKGEIKAEDYYPIESPAPGIIDRQPVNTPLDTGILTIDAMFPIGRGQRELIIGDRQTGKTAIALDAILNQKDKNVICIYVAIGQKASSVAQMVETLRKHDALKYSIVVNATASDAAPLQYIAPYAGCALGEYFMNHGQDVLIVYDDLSKHAIAYRALSLLLDRSPGREAYPGDVFYLHSRLLERSAHLSDEKGGGSMTALPIVETQVGDVSAYIPTNIISITDGQIFLESNLFFSGQRPAVNVGLSVSRVGGAAQTKAMKTAAGAIRLDLAQYREMEVFTQFSSDLDELTKKQLVYGQGLMQLLKQEQYHPLKQHEQVITLICALNHIMQDIPISQIKEFQKELLHFIEETEGQVCTEIDEKGVLTDQMKTTILQAAKRFQEQFLKQGR